MVVDFCLWGRRVRAAQLVRGVEKRCVWWLEVTEIERLMVEGYKTRGRLVWLRDETRRLRELETKDERERELREKRRVGA